MTVPDATAASLAGRCGVGPGPRVAGSHRGVYTLDRMVLQIRIDRVVGLADGVEALLEAVAEEPAIDHGAEGPPWGSALRRLLLVRARPYSRSYYRRALL